MNTKNRCSICGKETIAMGFCSTHYAREKQRRKIKALNDIMSRVEKLKSSRPELTDLLEDLVQEARPLYVDHRRKNPAEMSDPDLASEIASLKRELSSLKQVMSLLKKR